MANTRLNSMKQNLKLLLNAIRIRVVWQAFTMPFFEKDAEGMSLTFRTLTCARFSSWLNNAEGMSLTFRTLTCARFSSWLNNAEGRIRTCELIETGTSSQRR